MPLWVGEDPPTPDFITRAAVGARARGQRVLLHRAALTIPIFAPRRPHDDAGLWLALRWGAARSSTTRFFATVGGMHAP